MRIKSVISVSATNNITSFDLLAEDVDIFISHAKTTKQQTMYIVDGVVAYVGGRGDDDIKQMIPSLNKKYKIKISFHPELF